MGRTKTGTMMMQLNRVRKNAIGAGMQGKKRLLGKAKYVRPIIHGIDTPYSPPPSPTPPERMPFPKSQIRHGVDTPYSPPPSPPMLRAGPPVIPAAMLKKKK